MPWKEYNKMDEKVKFVARLLEGEKMSHICREFGISRKTGYKIWGRYKDIGFEGITDRSRRPYRSVNQLSEAFVSAIVGIKQEYPKWGAPKIQKILSRRYPDVKMPAISTIHAVLDKKGLVRRRKKRRAFKSEGTPLSFTQSPNDLWCADYKGEFLLGNKRYCYPLTISDFSSRYLLLCEALSDTKEKSAFKMFECTFKKHGLPRAIRTDNGVPFSSQAMFGLSKLSVWWLRLGIKIERIQPGHPEQNGRHERMHLTLKQEATRPAGFDLLQQQEKFEKFIKVYNNIRPHQALDMKTPLECYEVSKNLYKGLPDVDYPFHDKTITVTCCGRICVDNRKINFSRAFSGQKVGIKEVENNIWLVSFMDYDLGYFDGEVNRVEMGQNPFVSKVLPMSSE